MSSMIVCRAASCPYNFNGLCSSEAILITEGFVCNEMIKLQKAKDEVKDATEEAKRFHINLEDIEVTQ